MSALPVVAYVCCLRWKDGLACVEIPLRCCGQDFHSRNMALLSIQASREIQRFGRGVLRRAYGRRGRGIDTLRAATEATAVLKGRRYAKRGAVGSNRKLLAWVANGSPRRLQERVYRRLAVLLGCIEPGAETRCHAIALRRDWQLQALDNARVNQEWIESPSVMEEHELMGTLPPAIVARIEGFRTAAVEKGHPSWRVDAAVRRILAPFCAHARTRGIEHGWRDLHAQRRGAKATSLSRAVDAAITVEQLWMGDEPVTDRVLRTEWDEREYPDSDTPALDQALEEMLEEIRRDSRRRTPRRRVRQPQSAVPVEHSTFSEVPDELPSQLRSRLQAHYRARNERIATSKGRPAVDPLA